MCKDVMTSTLLLFLLIYSGDYGVFMLKFIELHSMNHSLKDVITDATMQYHRNRYVVEMFKHSIDPYTSAHAFCLVL